MVSKRKLNNISDDPEEIEQEFLKDFTENGKEIPWRKKKSNSVKMAEVFGHAKLEKKAERMASCGHTLIFNDTDEGLKLSQAYFCQIRLCPMCSWRRSLKISFQNKKIIQVANERHKLRWLFLTLTFKNPPASELVESIKHMMASWNRFQGYKQVKDNVVGWFRGLEITKNRTNGTYNPHFHVLMCVKPSYFNKKDSYIKHEVWQQLWKKAMKIDNYNPGVHIQVVKVKKKLKTVRQTIVEINDSTEGLAEEQAVFEVSKYAVKDSDIINYDDIDDAAETAKLLDKALSYKRLVAHGGLLKEIKQELKLKDIEEEDANLVNIDESDDLQAEECMKVMAYWHYGLNDYVLRDIEKTSNAANNGSHD
ncbi:protein rep [Priestia megaterium]